MTHPIVASARGWIGTRFHHQGRIKKTGKHKGGVDCLGLLAGVAAELDLRGPDGSPLIAFDETDYAHQPDTKRLVAKLSELLTIVIPAQAGIHFKRHGRDIDTFCTADAALMDSRLRGNDNIIPGDIALLRIDKSPQHLGIISDFNDGLGLIHAYAPARAVVEHALDDWWWKKIEAVFRVIIF